MQNSNIFSSNGCSLDLPSGYDDFFAQGVFGVDDNGVCYLLCENDSIHKFIIAFDGTNCFSLSLSDYNRVSFKSQVSFSYSDNRLHFYNDYCELIELLVDCLNKNASVIKRALKFKTYCLFVEGVIDYSQPLILSKETNLNNGYTIKVFCNVNMTVIAMPVYDYDSTLSPITKHGKILLNPPSVTLEFI